MDRCCHCFSASNEVLVRSVDPKELAALGAHALLHLAGMAVPWRWSSRLRTNLAEGDDEELADDSQDIPR